MKAKLIILTPVFNDWKNLDKLLTKINKLFHYKIKQKKVVYLMQLWSKFTKEVKLLI